MDKFTHVKVFSATKMVERAELGELVTRWLAEHPEVDVVDTAVRQSSDSQFHCMTITLFYKIAERAAR